MLVTDDGHMAFEPVEIQQRNDARDDVQHILRLEADVDDGGRGRRAPLEDELAEVAVASDQHALVRDRISQNLFIFRVWSDKARAHHIVPLRSQRSSDSASDIGVADQLQAARARPAAI